MSYRIYVTDSIRAQAQGKYFVDRWVDLIKPDSTPKDTRSADEIAFDVISKFGLKFRDEGGEE